MLRLFYVSYQFCFTVRQISQATIVFSLFYPSNIESWYMCTTNLQNHCVLACFQCMSIQPTRSLSYIANPAPINATTNKYSFFCICNITSSTRTKTKQQHDQQTYRYKHQRQKHWMVERYKNTIQTSNLQLLHLDNSNTQQENWTNMLHHRLLLPRECFVFLSGCCHISNSCCHVTNFRCQNY